MQIAFLDAEHGVRETVARVDGDAVFLAAEDVSVLTGWSRKPEGLCRDDVCVPVRDRELDQDGAIDIARMAAALGRPIVIDAAAGVVAWGERSSERRGPIAAGLAPDFTLPQLDGGSFTFSSLGRTKKLLLAWSSW